MDARQLAELRQLAAHVMDIAGRAMDGAEELHRRLSAAEDEYAADRERIADLSAERRRLKGA